jgi:hypothetical protein
MADLLALAGDMGSGADKKKRLRSAQVFALLLIEKAATFLAPGFLPRAIHVLAARKMPELKRSHSKDRPGG